MVRSVFFVSCMILSSVASAAPILAEAIEPSSVCDRFVTDKKKQSCLKTISQFAPDSYLAAICDKQTEPQGLYDCMGLASKFEFDPKKIQNCASEDLKDADRVHCLQTAGDSVAPVSPRLPANSKKNLKKKSAH